jgi:hypothetical protein
MVGALLGLPEPPRSDHTADALAVAICHASQAGTARVLGGAGVASVTPELRPEVQSG